MQLLLADAESRSQAGRRFAQSQAAAAGVATMTQPGGRQTTTGSAKRASDVESGVANLPALIARLGEDVLSLVDSKLSLLKIEIQEDVRAYGRALLAMSMAGVVGAIGFAFVNIAVAFALSRLLDGTPLSQPMQYAGGFGALGLLYAVVAGSIAIRAWRRLTALNPIPETTRLELQKDKRWLENE